jgi:peptidoglycan/LPS O-acetylase OafA/YrhL
MKTTGERLGALDGMKGIAAVMVAFFWHYQHFSPASYPFSFIAYWPYNHSWIMVDLFFVLSGFIFYKIYKRKIMEHNVSFKQFLVLRFSRLYPLHWLALIIVAVFQIIRKCAGRDFFIYNYNGLFYFLKNILLIQNGWLNTSLSFNGPAWSVSIEVMMYLIFFAIFYHSKNRTSYLVFYLLLIYLGMAIYFSRPDGPLVNLQVSRGLVGFFIGCITGEVFDYNSSNLKKVKTILLFLCILSILFLTIVPGIFGYKVIKSWHMVYTLVLFPSLIIVVLRVGFLSTFLSLKPFVYLGSLSYSIYLLHFPLQLIIKTIDEIYNLSINYSSKLFFFGFVLAVIFFSHISHFYFERPMQNFIRNKFKL